MLADLNLFATALILLAYLFGSVSSAVLVCQALELPDPRTTGSHNPGATNVLRTGSRRAAIITLLADLLKGALPVWLADYFQQSHQIIALCGLAAMLGHLFPLYFRFRGGKGVATFVGACLALQPLLALGQVILWLPLALCYRVSSIASICTALMSPLLCWWLARDYLPFVSLMAILLITKHHRNISNLLQGREARL